MNERLLDNLRDLREQNNTLLRRLDAIEAVLPRDFHPDHTLPKRVSLLVTAWEKQSR